MKKGFTLVELSIVLVIIGLLIGGILVGQSLINSAKQQSFIRQIQQFDISVANFKQKFKGLPGDSSKLNPSSGNNNGMIEEFTDNESTYFSGEIAAFWANLSSTELSGTNYTATFINPLRIGGTNPNIPSVSFDKTIGIIVAVTYNGVNSVFDAGTNIYGVAKFVTSPSSFLGNSTNAFKSVDAIAIDQKIDDAVATTGNIRAFRGDSIGFLATQSSGGNHNGCLKEGAMPQNYDTETESEVCSIGIKILSQYGNI